MNLKISSYSLRRLIRELKSGMGHDGIHSNYLKRVSDKFLNNLSYLLNACYTHCYIPNETLRGEINPTIKDQKGNSTESSNYRPVTQSSCILKLFEMHILEILDEKLTFDNKQFDFKKGISTANACYILKEIVYKYTKDMGKAFSTSVDLSETFDKVDHFILGTLLLERNIPPDVVLIFMHYLRNQTAKIVWNDASGDYHLIDTGVRQGGYSLFFAF